MNASFDPLHLVNTYGAFGSITRTRDEIVIEGTDDPEPGPDSVWREYGFKGKPTDPAQRPRQLAPYTPRLDWPLWFVPLGPDERRVGAEVCIGVRFCGFAISLKKKE